MLWRMNGSFKLFAVLIILQVNFFATGRLNDEYLHTIPQHVFTVTCVAEALNSTESAEWSFVSKSITYSINKSCHYEDSFVQNGMEYKRTQLKGKIVVDEERKFITELLCQNVQDGSWIKETMFPRKLKFPGEMLLRSDCFSSKIDATDQTLIEIGDPPSAPQNLTCTIQIYETLHCQWKAIDLPSSSGQQDPIIFYTMIVSSPRYGTSGRACLNTFENSCTTNLSSIETTGEKIRRQFFMANIKVTVIANNSYSSTNSSITCLPPVCPKYGPQQVSTNSVYSKGKQQVNLQIAFQLDGTTDEKLTEQHILAIDMEYLFTNESLEDINRLTKELRHSKTNQLDFSSCRPSKKSLIEPDLRSITSSNGHWINVKTNGRGEAVRKYTKDDVLANATVIVRTRFKFHEDENADKSCGENMWSPFNYSIADKTKPIPPGKVKVSVLWWHDQGSSAADVAQSLVMMIVYEKNTNIRYMYNSRIDEYLWSLNCSGRRKLNIRKSLTCDFQLQAENEIGLSEPRKVKIVEDVHYQIENVTLSEGTEAPAIVQFKISSDTAHNCFCKPENVKCMQCSTVTFIWEIKSEMPEDILKNDVLQNPAGNYHLRPFFGEKNYGTEHDRLFIKSSNGTFLETEAFENADSRPPIKFTTSPITRNKDGYYISPVHFDFKPFVIYGFAISLKCRESLWPATVLSQGYTLSRQAPKPPSDSIKIEVLSPTSINVSWTALTLENQGAPVFEYRVYVSKRSKCGNPEKVAQKLACSEICGNPSTSLPVSGRNSNVWSKEDIMRAFSTENKRYKKVDHLQEDTVYHVTISAVNSEGESPCSKEKFVKSLSYRDNTGFVALGTLILFPLLVVAFVASCRRRFKKWNRIPKPIIFVDKRMSPFEDRNSRMPYFQEADQKEVPTPYIPENAIKKNSSETLLLDPSRMSVKYQNGLHCDKDIEFISSKANFRDEEDDGYTDATEAFILSQSQLQLERDHTCA